jgi:large subunit ribosomal protein L4
VKPLSHNVVDMKGKKVGSMDLDPEVFAAPIKQELVHAAVRWQRAKRRSGTHSTLNRKAMKGGGRKPYKQKGTGRARIGSSNSPIRVGGAVVFGPRPKSYEFKFPRKIRNQALKSVLTHKFNNDEIVILSELKIESGKTRDLCTVLDKLKIRKSSAMLLMAQKDSAEQDTGVWRSSSNIKNVVALPVAGINVYDLLRCSRLVGTKDSIADLQSRLKSESAVTEDNK